MSRRIPKYRHYKPKNLGMVVINDRAHYLGKYDTPESWERYHRLIPGLRKGRSTVREKPPVGPVPDADVAAVRPHVCRKVRAMIELQRLTGMRPGEVVIMRTGDLEMGGDVWIYTPSRHKTEHH